MKENFDEALKAILHHEGNFVNHPKDPGGMTNLGVTKRVWEEWVGHEVDEKAMRALTPADVDTLYRRKYWDKVRGDELPAAAAAFARSPFHWFTCRRECSRINCWRTNGSPALPISRASFTNEMSGTGMLPCAAAVAPRGALRVGRAPPAAPTIEPPIATRS